MIAYDERDVVRFSRLDPVCDTCDDTHLMELGDRTVMCTRCPTPCQECRRDGNGPYCAKTPCACACHVRHTEPCACITPRRTSQVTVVLTIEHHVHRNLDRLVQRALDRYSEALATELEADGDVTLEELRVGTVMYGTGGGK